LTLSTLCEDNLYFSHPGSFNDPLDCSPTLNCDSSNEELQKLLAFFITKRVTSEIISNIKKAKIKISDSTEHAKKMALQETEKNIAHIAYLSTNPEYGAPSDQNESWLLLQAIERELHQWYERGVCCFSTSYSSPLLWSHYGDQHQGLCIGYTTNRNPVPQPRKVVYGGGRSINTSILFDAFLNQDINATSDVDRDVLLRKAKGWKYESEWRLIGEQGLQPSPLNLSEVIFGLRCDPSVIHSVIKALENRDNEVKFYRMNWVRNSFSLRRSRVDIDEIQACMPVVAKSGIEMFGDL
jgi:hypothetical protein